MTPLEYVSCGLVISIISGIIGHTVGSKGKVGNSTCSERRDSCTATINAKLDNIVSEISDLKKLVINGSRRQ
jgi:hypothetical protein